ncbi:MAG: hypothetical protein V9E90_05055 [Saprospiraceae bacterium]|jgi:hypothetical protein
MKNYFLNFLRIGLILFLVQSFPNTLSAQSEILEIREDKNSQIAEDCQNVKRDIKDLMSKFIIRFQQASTFIDLSLPPSSEMLVTPESQEKFTKMFAYSSRVYNDLMDYPITVSPQDYAAFVARHYNKGIPIDQLYITDVYLKSINYNADAQIYEIALKINKLLYTSILTENIKEKKYKQGRLHTLDMQLNLPKTMDPKDLVIISITGPFIVKPKPLTKWFNLDAIVGLNKPSITTNIWVLDNSGSKLNVSHGLSAGIGFTYFNELFRNKGHYLVVGVHGMMHQFNISSDSIDNSFSNQILQRSNIKGKNIVRYSNYSEGNNFTIEALVGLSLSLKKNYRSNLGLGVYFKPYFVLNASKAKGDITILQQIGEEKPWCVDPIGSLSIGGDVNSNGFYFVLSPFYEKEVNSNGTNRFRVNLDINCALTSWFKNTTFNGDTNSPLGNNTIIYSKFLPHYLGLRFEYMFKMNNK